MWTAAVGNQMRIKGEKQPNDPHDCQYQIIIDFIYRLLRGARQKKGEWKQI